MKPGVVLKILVLLFFTFIQQMVLSQIYPVKRYAVEDGLINSNVYYTRCDSRGFIWMGTENGLSRFDGISYLNFTLEDLKVESDITSVIPFGKDEIVFGCENGGIYRMDITGNNISRINSGQVSKSDDLIVRDSLLISLQEFRRIEFISINTGKVLAIDSLAHFDGCDIPVCITSLQNGDILVGRTTGLYKLSGFSFIQIPAGEFSKLPVYSVCEDETGNIYAGSDNLIYLLSKTGGVVKLYNESSPEPRIRNVLYDKRGNLWFKPWGTSVLKMLHESHITDVSAIVGGMNAGITRLNMSPDGSIWCGTMGKGVFKFSGQLLLNYPYTSGLDNPNIHKLKRTSTGLLMGTSDGIAHLNFQSDKIDFIKHIPDVSLYVRDIIELDSMEFLVGITDYRLKQPFRKLPLDGNLQIRYVQSSGLLVEEPYLYAANWDNRYLKYLKSDFRFIDYVGPLLPEFNYNLRINTLFRDINGHLWIGSKHGLRIENVNGEKFTPVSDINRYEVFSISATRGDTVQVITSNGLYLFNSAEEISNCSEIDRVAVSSTSCLVQTGNEEYLFGTSEGLLFVQGDFKKRITVHDGLPSNIIGDLLMISADNVYIGTAEGLSVMDMNALRRMTGYKPEINYIEVKRNGKPPLISFDKVNLEYNSDAINVVFRSFYYQNPESVTFQYRLDQSEWKNSTGGEIQFASFEPGDHLIEIRSGLEQMQFGKVVSIPLTVSAPFFRTWWFYALVLFASFSLLFLFYSYQIKIYRKKQQEKSLIRQKIVELQQKALASTLNPHFVFNSLNSIQHFININSIKDANVYLARFSRLMRLHLDMADRNFILLSEEMERLRYYLNLEQMRFGEKLTYDIHIDDSINAEQIEIPNMIIQPFVENAIWHGIMPSDQKGEIQIEVRLCKTKSLEIVIADNGVGLSHSSTDRKSHHEPKGVKLIRERLALLDPAAGDCLIFEDLTPGTKVKVTLSEKMFRPKKVVFDVENA